ncbi:hypothetical protein FRX31_025088 [Thalictrum thalictroides]|uniref:Uncharacterized protein n=1 Tax=Thalictrum thalictroides TaxID=46969 RepID=A0A7J6VK73_THATH|nr:hypothetical protein FRX31_025088 [Thalictrum thalictroides]
MASRFSQYALAYARGLIRAFVPKRDGGPPIFRAPVHPDPIPPKPVSDPPPRTYDPNARCDYHMGSPGHWTDRCYNLRHRIQDLRDQPQLQGLREFKVEL